MPMLSPNRQSVRLVVLGALVCSAVAACAVVFREPAGVATDNAQQPWLPDLTEQAVLAEHVIIHRGTIHYHMHKGEDGQWTLEEANDYPVDSQRLQRLFQQLAMAEKQRATTRDPSRYDQLGLDATRAWSVRVEDARRKPLLAVDIGHMAKTGHGTYVRLQDDAQSWRIDQTIQLPPLQADWLVQPALAIAPAEVQQVEIAHRDGSRLIAKRLNADSDMQLHSPALPDADPMAVARLGQLLEHVRFIDVMPRSRFKPRDAVLATSRFTLFDGRLITVQPVLHMGRYWLLIDQKDAKKPGETDSLFVAQHDTHPWVYAVPDHLGAAFASRPVEMMQK